MTSRPSPGTPCEALALYGEHRCVDYCKSDKFCHRDHDQKIPCRCKCGAKSADGESWTPRPCTEYVAPATGEQDCRHGAFDPGCDACDRDRAEARDRRPVAPAKSNPIYHDSGVIEASREDLMRGVKEEIAKRHPDTAPHVHRCGCAGAVLCDRHWTLPSTEPAPETGEDFDNTALQILCRVFDDGADVAMEEWRAYDKTKWLSPERALGGFIRSRLDRLRSAPPLFTEADAQDLRELASDLDDGTRTPFWLRDLASRISDHIAGQGNG